MYFRKVCKLAIGSIRLLRKTSTRSSGYAATPSGLWICAHLSSSSSFGASATMVVESWCQQKKWHTKMAMDWLQWSCKRETANVGHVFFVHPGKLKDGNKKKWRWMVLNDFPFPNWPFSASSRWFSRVVFQSSRLGFQQSLVWPQKWSGFWTQSRRDRWTPETDTGHYWWQCFKD